jgi:hypothetical protein
MLAFFNHFAGCGLPVPIAFRICSALVVTPPNYFMIGMTFSQHLVDDQPWTAHPIHLISLQKWHKSHNLFKLSSGKLSFYLLFVLKKRKK